MDIKPTNIDQSYKVWEVVEIHNQPGPEELRHTKRKNINKLFCYKYYENLQGINSRRCLYLTLDDMRYRNIEKSL